MDDLSIYTGIAPATKTELEQIAEEVRYLSLKTAEISYRTGECLSRARDLFKHNKNGGFQEWLILEFGESSQRAYEYINFFETCEKSTFHDRGKLDGISQRKLFKLAAPSMPEGSLESAVEAKKNGEVITEKWIKKHKEDERIIEELKTKCAKLEASPQAVEIKPNIDNLIPGVKEVFDRNGIMESKALKISVMPPEGQQQWLSIYVDNLSLENQLNEKTAKVKELEDRPEPEPEEIIVEKMPEGAEQKIKDAEKKDRQATKIFKTIDQLKSEKAELEATSEDLNRERNELARKIKVFEESTTTATPASIDDSRFIKLTRLNKELDWIFPDILKEAELAGGHMPKSKGEILDIISKWTGLMQEIDGRTVIDI